MGRGRLFVLMLAGVGGVLAVSLGILRRERRIILRDFQASEARVAKEAAGELLGYLNSFDRDARLLAALAARARAQKTIDEPAQDQVVREAFEALAVIIPHYRTLVLEGSSRRRTIAAVDPTEEQTHVIPALLQASAELAHAVAQSGHAGLRGPLTLGDRSFYLYGAPASSTDAVVVSADANLMLQIVARGRGDQHVMVVTDPSDAIWIGCENAATCLLLRPGESAHAALRRVLSGASPLRDPGPPRFFLPTRAVVGQSPPTESPLGRWSVSMTTSAGEIETRERTLVWQLILTSAGVITTMLTAGFFIVRQRSAAAALAARLQAAEEVAALRRDLLRAEKLVTVGVLSAGIAHDVGTPLSVIRGRAEHLLEKIGDGPAGEDLQAIVSQIDRIASTIKQVLELPRTQAVELAHADAPTAVTRVLELLEMRLVRRSLRVERDFQPGLPAIAANPQQFERVLVNLLMNSCDASPRGGVIEVTLAVDTTRPDRLRIELRDHGVGIAPEHVDAVFDPYFTTKERGEGTGLGLAVVARVVRIHGAEIGLRSAPGTGTTVTLLWPTVETKAAAVA
jgi:signal transduction histidine kinase